MMYPTLHKSKWDGPTIKAEYQEATEAVSAAIVAYARIAFFERKYSSNRPVPAGHELELAHREHVNRFNRLINIRAELEEIVAAVDDQIFGRVG